MIKFFRHIRKSLLMENKTGKYLKYAIGEIVLVVVGILIALQINTWNENRKERVEEQTILKQLQTEFKSNLEQLDDKIAIRTGIIYSATQLVDAIDHPKERIKDSIDKYIATTIGYTTFDPIVSDHSNSASLKLIQNDSLKQLLSFWTSEVIQVTEVEETWYQYRNNIYLPFIIEHYQLRTARNGEINNNYLKKFQIDKNTDSNLLKSGGIGNTKHKEDFNALLELPDYEDHLIRCIITNNIAEVQAVTLRKRIVTILDIIDKEIKN